LILSLVSSRVFAIIVLHNLISGCKLVSGRLLKNAHLLRFPHPSSLRRTVKYGSLLRISRALHLAFFEQPEGNDFFSNLLHPEFNSVKHHAPAPLYLIRRGIAILFLDSSSHHLVQSDTLKDPAQCLRNVTPNVTGHAGQRPFAGFWIVNAIDQAERSLQCFNHIKQTDF